MNPGRGAAALAALSVAAGGAVVLYLADPALSGWYPRCPFHELTGFYCPGCGSLRSLHQLLHGHLAQAARLNLMMLAAGPYMAFEALASALDTARGGPVRAPHVPRAWVRALLLATLAFGVLRNLPFPPFDLLRP